MWFVRVQARLFCISDTPFRSTVAPQLWYYLVQRINSLAGL